MKIIFIANGAGLSDKLGGSITRTINLAKKLVQKGHEVHFLTTIGGFNACKRLELDVNYHILPASFWSKSERGFFDRLLSYAISTFASPAKMSQLPKVEVIYTDSDYFFDTIPAVLYKNKFKDVQWIASTYHFIPSPSERSGGLKFFNLLSYMGQQIGIDIITRRADLISTETNFVKYNLVRNQNVNPDKILVTESGIDASALDSVKWEGAKIYDACYLGGLRTSKGIFDLIEAWANVCNQNKDAKLAIAGGSSNVAVAEVKQKIKDLGLENNISILGFLSETDKIKLYKSSRLYVLPSHEEGIPITFYEAMYCGLPVVTFYLPTYSEMKEYIQSVPLGDVEGLATKIMTILSDEELMHKLSVQGRKLACKHTWDNVVDSIYSHMKH